MKLNQNLALAAVVSALAALPLMAEPADCLKLAATVKHDIKAQPSKVLEIVEARVAANEDCACEIVKAAIQSSEADEMEVAGIVEAAATAAPAKMRLIAQCAVAVAPDSLAKVQGVMARLDPSAGEAAVVSAKGGMEKAAIAPAEVAPNPLDFPIGTVPPIVGPPAGGPPIFPPGLPPTQPPVVTPPVTGVSLYYLRNRGGSSSSSIGDSNGNGEPYPEERTDG